ncbi:unnamed protein product, partial [Phaeothamnion confervicola]
RGERRLVCDNARLRGSLRAHRVRQPRAGTARARRDARKDAGACPPWCHARRRHVSKSLAYSGGRHAAAGVAAPGAGSPPLGGTEVGATTAAIAAAAAVAAVAPRDRRRSRRRRHWRQRRCCGCRTTARWKALGSSGCRWLAFFWLPVEQSHISPRKAETAAGGNVAIVDMKQK